jgi:WD40 repeat protein
VAFSPTGGRLAAGTRTGKVWLWDLRTRTKRLLTGQGGAVRRIRFGPRGRQLATASWDHLVRIWSLKGDAPVAPRVLRGHADRVYGIDFSPDGRRLASGSYDKTVRIWDLANGARALRTLEGHTDRVLSVSFSPDGKLLASGSQDGTVRLWDLEKGKCRAVLVAHTDGVREVRFSRDGKVLASAGADRVIHLWDPFKGEVTHTLTGHGAGVTGVDFSPDGTRLASTSFDKTVRLWDLTAAEPPRGVGHTDRVNGVAFSPDGKLVVSASSDRTVRIWDVKSGAQRRVIRGHRDGVIRAVFSPDGKLVASAGWSKVIRIWDVASGGQRQVLVGHRGEVEDMLFSPGDKTPLPARRSGVPDGQRLVTASWDRTIRVWKVESGALERELRGHEAGVRSVDLAPDGDTLASGSGDGSIRLWSVGSGRQKRELKGHESTVTSVSFGPGGARLASGSYDGTVRLWDIARGGKERSDAARGSGATHVTARGTHRIVGRHEGRIYQVSFHTSGKLVGSAGSDSVARLWDLERGSSVVLASHAQTVNGIGFDTSGELAATVSDDGSVRLWRVATGAPVWRAAVYASTPPRIHTHRGWVLGGAAPAGAPGPERVISATPMASGGLCVRTDENRLQVWEGGKRLLDQRIAGLEQVTALGESCVVLAKGRVQLYRSTGWFKDLRGGVSAISVSDGTLILATNDQLLVFDGEGGLRSSFPAPPGVSALARTRSGRIALGFEDGGLTATARRGKTDGRGAALAFDGTSATAVTRLLRGPRDTIIAGHADGLVGIWLEEGGPRLDHVNMHGPVVHLSLHRGRAYVVTDLGDHRVWDLRPYFDDYCTFLRAVWRVVPVVWEQGTARLREPPADHRCALSSRRGS